MSLSLDVASRHFSFAKHTNLSKGKQQNKGFLPQPNSAPSVVLLCPAQPHHLPSQPPWQLSHYQIPLGTWSVVASCKPGGQWSNKHNLCSWSKDLIQVGVSLMSNSWHCRILAWLECVCWHCPLSCSFCDVCIGTTLAWMPFVGFATVSWCCCLVPNSTVC